MVRIGNPGDDAANDEVRKDVNVIVMRKGDGTTDVKDLGDGKKVIIVKNGDGKVLTEDIKPVDGERRIVVKKADGYGFDGKRTLATILPTGRPTTAEKLMLKKT